MKMSNKTIELKVDDPSYCKILNDPRLDGVSHVECLLNFREAFKLKLGNANVRPPMQNKRPFRAMLNTVEYDPGFFHIKNRGITYICTGAKFDERSNKLIIEIPEVPLSSLRDTDRLKFGIADGGHTFEVVQQTVNSEKEFENIAKWEMPYVRVHFLITTDLENVEPIVEALNTSSQVQQYTLDEYQNKFKPLKDALDNEGFPLDLVAFRENEDKEWHVIEIIQRTACFLKDRWKAIAPINMYKSKGKALKLFTGDTQTEFRELFPVIRDVITLPEFIQSRFSTGGIVNAKSLGKLKCVKPEKKTFTRPGTEYPSDHKIDMAALLPIAAAFRELLVKTKNVYDWRCDYKEVFELAASDLFDHMVLFSGRAAQSSQMATEPEYWSGCSQIVMRAKDDYLETKGTKSMTRRKARVEEESDSSTSQENEDEFSQVEAHGEDDK